MNSDAWGGSEEIWFHAAFRLVKKKYRVGICCFNWPGKEKKLDELAKAGCEIYLLPGRNETRSVWKKIKLNASIRKIPVESFDKVFVNQGGWKDIVHSPFKNVYSRCKNYSVIYHNYDYEKLSPGKLKLFQKWITNARNNIGDAQKIFSVIAEKNPITIPNQEVLFNPITFAPPNDYTAFTSLPADKLKLIVLAQLDVKRTAQDILITTLSTEKWKARNWELRCYGRGNDEALLTKLIKATGLSDKVFLKGYTNDIPAALTWSHILLHLTHIDAMPISVSEAMAISRPVIASNVGDMPLWINDNVNGWIANEVSVESIDAALEKAWQNRTKLEKMGRESFNIFTKKYPADPVSHFLNIVGIKETLGDE